MAKTLRKFTDGVLKRIFPYSFKKLGLLFCIAGIVILSVKYMRFPFFVRDFFVPDVPLWLDNAAWGLLLVGFLFQYFDAE
ncbi:membrane protein [Candidatus Omnitrophus magneticus]|uniref:Membrane protein n=1 Tax=Candidatus Omnitrophus magneticus TaxID=1609969 RepID=A0A0F0CMT3_9BACT|nr:membrane protein [Candidatus Omnitrophus magneticus]